MVGDTSAPHETTVTEYLQDLILDSVAIEDFLAEMVHLSVKSLSGTGPDVLCGITLCRHRKSATVASSNETAQRMDEIQYNYPDEPCLSAAREQTKVMVEDLRTEGRWPEYTAVVLKEGVRSILAVPFQLEGEATAALNLYSTEPSTFSDGAVGTVEAYAREMSWALRIAVRLARHNDTELNLKAAMESRTVIDLAVGVLMGQSRCSQDEAAAMLKAAASNRNIKLRALAADIVSAIGDGEVKTHFEE